MSCFEKLTHSWILPIVKYGNARDLKAEMFVAHEETKEDLTSHLHSKLESQWHKYKEGYSFPLARSLIMTFTKEMTMDACFHIVQSCLGMASPLLIKYIVDFASETPSQGEERDISFGLMCVVLLTVV